MDKIASVGDVKRVNLYFVQSRWKELQAISRKTGTPVAELVRRAVDEWLKKQKKTRYETRRATISINEPQRK